MMRIDEREEPENFDFKVRRPGMAYLGSLPPDEKPNFRGREYWRRCGAELRLAYGAVCAYTSFHVPAVTGAETVEHFQPKSREPSLAYEWSNYRFVCGRMNSRKGAREIVDPFRIPKYLFILQVPSMLLLVNKAVDADLSARAWHTIEVLGLNDELCVPQRLDWVVHFVTDAIALPYLKSHAPFIARELKRQRLTKVRLRRMLGIPR